MNRIHQVALHVLRSATPSHALPLSRLLGFEKRFAIHRRAALLRMVRVPVGEIAFIGVIAARASQT